MHTSPFAARSAVVLALLMGAGPACLATQPPRQLPWTVADSVSVQRVPHWMDNYGDGAPFKYSPDNDAVAFVVLQPQVGTPTTIATLRVYNTAQLKRYAAGTEKSVPSAALEFSLPSNFLNPGIGHLRWSKDGGTLGFIGETQDEGNAVYLWKRGDQQPRLVLASQGSERMGEFHFLGDANDRLAILTISAFPKPSDAPELVNGHTLMQSLGLDAYQNDTVRPQRLSVLDLRSHKQRSFDVTLAAGYGVWPSPDGNHVASLEPYAVKWEGSCWREEPDVDLSRNTVLDPAQTRYVVIDTRNGHLARPTVGPTGVASPHFLMVEGEDRQPGIYWSADSSVAVAPFSLSAADACDAKKTVHGVPAAYTFAPDGSDLRRLTDYTAVPNDHGVHAVNVQLSIADDGHRIDLAARPGFGPKVSGHSTAWQMTSLFTRAPDGSWRSSEAPNAPEETADTTLPALLEVRQDYNDPPAIVASATGGAHRELYDLAPHARGRVFTRIEEFVWKDSKGRDWHGLLAYPRGFSAGKRYPLLLQTHSYPSHVFYTTGVDTTTAFPGRAAAERGFMVLTVNESGPLIGTAEEPDYVLDGYRSAIRELDHRGRIDPAKVGAIGWSRTGWYVFYATAFAPDLFKAAVAADNVDYGYMGYLFKLDQGQMEQMATRGVATLYGGPPWGNWQAWLARNPAMNADKIKAPTRFEANSQRVELLEKWESYASLRMNHVPTELWVYPRGMHLLIRPIDQQTSQEGSLDWIDYWVNGHRDLDPAKAAQYERWDAMRTERAAAVDGKSGSGTR